MLINYGLSVIPVDVKTKAPLLKTWKQYQSKICSESQCKKWSAGGAIAIICGKVSGNLEMLDFDNKAEFYDEWASYISQNLLDKLVIETSQSGGKHVIYRLAGVVQGNRKLAMGIDNNVRIETRGEGGYFICAPSPGYQLIQNDFSNILTLSESEHAELIQSAKACNQAIPKEIHKQEKRDYQGIPSWQDYDDRTDPTDLLCDYGWQRVGRTGRTHNGGVTCLLRRPGKDRGVSGSVIDGKIFYCFSTNAAPFESEKGYPPSAVYAILRHNGDFSASAKDLYQQGFGDRQEKKKQLTGGIKPFWYETINNKGEAILNISHTGLLDFVMEKGFFNTEYQKEKILVQRINNLLRIREIDDIRHDMINVWLPEFPWQVTENKHRCELKEVLIKGINIYIQESKIETLKRKEMNLLKDTENETYFFFSNGCVKVDAKNISLIGYDKIKGDIWEKSIMNHNISINYDSQSVYEQFITNISNTSDRYKAICTAHGYLLNRYNNFSYAPAVILSDGIIGDKPDGGTGKGIITQALAKCRNCAIIDGKTTDLKNTFALQKIELQSEIVCFNDVNKNFPFEKLFSNITEGYTVEKKNKNVFSFQFADNPKTLITTNYAIRGDGHSFERRKEEIELFMYYGESGKKPEDDFGTLFDWDKNEWNNFYNFIFQCVQMYHRNGNRIAKYQSETLELKKTITETGLSFYEFAEEIPLDEWLVSSEYYEEYLATISKRERDFMSSNKFGRLLTSYCKSKGLTLDKKKVNSKKCFKINN